MEGVWPRTDVCGPNGAKPPLEEAIAELAEHRHNVVTADQLETLGLGSRGIRHRAARGRLHTLYRSVYAVGSRKLTREGHFLAAVYACGPSAVLSHRSAAALWGLRASSQTKIDVTSPRRSGRRHEGIRVHSGATLAPRDITSVHEVPCTTVPRTLLDLADVLSLHALDRAVHESVVHCLFDGRAVNEILESANGRRGAAKLRAVLADPGHLEGPTSHIGLEERFLALCETNGLPRPEVNVRVQTAEGSLEVDFLWRGQRLIVETDSRRFHSTVRALERDDYRDALLGAAGYRVRRCRWREVVYEPGLVAAELRERLTGGIAARLP